MNSNPLRWPLSALIAILGLFGLALAAHGVDMQIQIFGFGLFVFAVVFVFAQIKGHFDDFERERARSRH